MQSGPRPASASELSGRTWAALGAIAVAFLTYTALTARGGVPDPTETQNLSHGAVVLNSALLVFREGLEAILVIAAITASFLGGDRSKRRPVGLGAGLAFVASVVTWFLADLVIGALGGPGLDIQAATGLLAVIVLLVVMNWFFHNVYWTGWIAHHHRRRRRLLGGGNAVVAGLLLLGFTAVYREGFEVVLFLQSLRLQYGASTVLEGVALGLGFTAIVGALTFIAQHKLPYKRMLVLTGLTIGFVLIVMVGEGAQEMQLAGWIPTTPIGVIFPGWIGTWFAVFPTLETLTAQALAASLVIASYLISEHVRVRRPARQGLTPGHRAEHPPTPEPLLT